MTDIDYKWLKPLKVGMKVQTISPHNAYAGQTMTIMIIMHDPNKLMNGFVKLKLQKKVHNKRYSTTRVWWIYQECKLV